MHAGGGADDRSTRLVTRRLLPLPRCVPLAARLGTWDNWLPASESDGRWKASRQALTCGRLAGLTSVDVRLGRSFTRA